MSEGDLAEMNEAFFDFDGFGVRRVGDGLSGVENKGHFVGIAEGAVVLA